MTVTMDDEEWHNLTDAAECAGMTVEAYLCWTVRLLAAQSRPGKNLAGAARGQVPARRKRVPECEESESTAWTDTFTERLTHRAETYRDD